MLHATTITHCAAILGVLAFDGPVGQEPAVDPVDAAYRAAAEEAGRDAEAHVRLALWCEQNGLGPEAVRHLAMASVLDAENTVARGLMGLVDIDGRWRKPEEAARLIAADDERNALREEYEGRRSRLDPTADDHWRLGLWCESHGLEDEADAHFHAVTRLDPGRDAAWKRLGYKKHGNRWMTDPQIKDATQDAEAQAEADRLWGPRLAELHGMLAEPARSGEAVRALAAIDDPRALPAIWRTFVHEPERDQIQAVQLLGQLDAPRASEALASMAVSSQHAEVRRLATETLRGRDPRGWAGPLVSAVREPIAFEVRSVGGPGSPGVLFIEGQEASYQRIYQVTAPPRSIPSRAMMPGESYQFDAFGNAFSAAPFLYRNPFPQEPSPLAQQLIEDPKRAVEILRSAGNPQNGGASDTLPRGLGAVGSYNIAGDWLVAPKILYDPGATAQYWTQRATLQAQERLETDVHYLNTYNTTIEDRNARILPVLQQGTGVGLGVDPDGWQDWWLDEVGYRAYRRLNNSTAPRVVTELVSVPVFIPRRPIRTGSCFAAGTPVWTDRGLAPIETLAMGDRVLGQDPESGALSYRTVLAAHHNPPSKTLAVRIDGEAIVATHFHRFWVAGEGWRMARELRVGDLVRLIGRTAQVEAIEDGQIQPVYNLDVAGTRSFFAGRLGALVHDNTLPDGTETPFDAAPELVAVDHTSR